MKKTDIIKTSLGILLGSMLYAAATVLFIFPDSVLLGGTSGISVILHAYLPFSSGTILTFINAALLIAAFIVLGKGMAVRTLVGSVMTTVLVWVVELAVPDGLRLIPNTLLSAITGALVIAVASGVLFYVDSSSGGTDILALIVKKFSGIHIGRALMITDIAIVIVGGLLSGWKIFFCSLIGLLIKTTGIDLVIALLKRHKNK